MGPLNRLLRRWRHRQDGSELIELAIVLPILLLVIAAIIDFGFLFQRYEVVTNAAREGARVAVLPNYTNADVVARVQAYLTASGMTCPDPYVSPQGSLTQALPSGLNVDLREVVVLCPTSFPYLSPIASLVGAGPHASITLRGSSVMRSEAAAGGGS